MLAKLWIIALSAMVYEIGSKGSIVTERLGKELSVFYQNGENLEMAHFCNAGNQPRLRLKKTGEAEVFDFEGFAVTNLNFFDAPHVGEIIYELVDPDTIKLEIVWSPKTHGSEVYTL